MSAPQPQMIFVNLPVQDLEKSKAFFDRAGLQLQSNLYQ